MSTLYVGSDPCSLADRLADDLDRQAKDGDFFTPALIVVPNRYLKKWLRLRLARRHDVAINLKFQYLEDALWDLLRAVDPSPEAARPETIDENTYRLMVLSVLLEADDPDLAPLRRYLQVDGTVPSRLTCRRAWYLADRLGARVRDYEYNRQDMLIQPWLTGHLGLTDANAYQQMMECAQRAVFQHITREPDGKRALLNQHREKTHKTFPQYAMELVTTREGQAKKSDVVHFFGFTQVSELHARTIAWLGKSVDIRFHHLNVLASSCNGDLSATAQAFKDASDAENVDSGRELLRLWGKAGAESMWLASLISNDGEFAMQVLPSVVAGAASVLTTLRSRVLAYPEQMPHPLAQDTSVQIIGCPGVVREVETVYNSILHNLQNDPTLRQTDIAVLVTDMPRYRAALEAAFERPPQRLQYNLVDFSAAGISTFGQAVLGMLDLALESFSRSRVFEVLLNSCFLARLGVDRSQAIVWLDWAENLGIYQGWDADEKERQGYARSPFYAWRLGLQRLRLGRFMQVERDERDRPAPRFGNVIPFADLESSDREQLDPFCRAVEGLLPTLAKLRTARMSGERWARELEKLVGAFLDVPPDQEAEGQVRAELLASLATLSTWDALGDAGSKAPGMPLALVREYVQTQLEVLAGNRGEYLIGGVSIAALQPMRPVPFAIVYILGLSEDLFPGSNALSSFDLRGVQRVAGDVRPAEARLYDFLATVLSAQRKLYLLYNNRDLQKDQAILPAVPLLQLQHYLSRHVVQGRFETVEMPMHAEDAAFLDAAKQPAYQDVLVQYRDADRRLALAAARHEDRIALASDQEAEWARKSREFDVDFSIPPEPAELNTIPVTISVRELRRYLMLPVQESLRRHLRIDDDEEQTVEDDEPLVTPQQVANGFSRQTIQKLVLATAKGEVQQRLGNWKEQFAASYAEARLRSQVPEEAFGEIDQAAILHDLDERIHGQGGIEEFLRKHASMQFCGPVLLGESLTPIGARFRFPALRLPAMGCNAPASNTHTHRLGDPPMTCIAHASFTHTHTPGGPAREIRVIGSTNYVWQSPGRIEMLIVSMYKSIDDREVHPSMFEPMLLYLALLANDEPNADGMSSQRWLIERDYVLHVAHTQGIRTWTYPKGIITPTEALHYLMELTRDFLDPGQFDLLPFETLRNRRELLLACHDDFSAQTTPEMYRAWVEAAVAEQRENRFGTPAWSSLVEMAKPSVPADALAKVRRRFGLLDRGPALIRARPKFTKPRRLPQKVTT